MAREVLPHLMFTGNAGEALAFYATLFPDSAVRQVEHHGPDGPGVAGTVRRAILSIAGRDFQVVDSPPVHAFTFTPSFSIFVECSTEAEMDEAYGRLMAGGKALMPVGDYGFSKRFGWATDRFGVSWQLNLA